MAHKKWYGLRPAIGLIIDQREIALSVVATTALGRHEVHRDVGSYEDDGVEPVLSRMLEPWLKKAAHGKRRGAKPWVQIGLPESRVFEATVPITAANRLYSPQNFFLEAVQSTNLRAEDRIIDMVKVELHKQQFACLSACPCVLVADQLEVLERLDLRIAEMEPAPSGLLRAGEHWSRTPRTSKLSQRMFLGRNKALGMAVAHGHPLFWYGFELTPGDETKAIMGAYSTLWMMGRHSRIATPIDTLVIHGRGDLALSLDPDAFRERTGARLIRASEPGYDLGAAAFGIALNNPLSEPTPLDLGRAIRSPVSVGDIFPWGELVLQGLMVGGVSLFLIAATLDMETRFKSVESQTRSYPWLGKQEQARLDQEKSVLEQRIKVVDTFVKSRVPWSAQLRTLAFDTPDTTVITSLTGEAPLQGVGKARPGQSKKQMVVSFSTPLSKDGTMPSEVNELIARLRGEPIIQKQFPNIEATGFRAVESSGSKTVTYSVVCLPGTEPAKTEPVKKAVAR